MASLRAIPDPVDPRGRNIAPYHGPGIEQTVKRSNRPSGYLEFWRPLLNYYPSTQMSKYSPYSHSPTPTTHASTHQSGTDGIRQRTPDHGQQMESWPSSKNAEKQKCSTLTGTSPTHSPNIEDYDKRISCHLFFSVPPSNYSARPSVDN